MQWLAHLPHSTEVLGLNPVASSDQCQGCVGSLWKLQLEVELTDESKFAVGVNVCPPLTVSQSLPLVLW